MIPQWLKYGVPRYLRHNGILYRLPRGYRKRLQRRLDAYQMGTLFQITYEMWRDGPYGIMSQMCWRP